MAPESMNQNVYYKESDVYSFGIMAYELFHERDAFKVKDMELVQRVINDKLRPEIDEVICGETIQVMIESCWNDNWKERCSFDDICKMLLKTIIEENDNENY